MTVREDEFSLEMLTSRCCWNEEVRVSSGKLQVDEGTSSEMSGWVCTALQDRPSQRGE